MNLNVLGRGSTILGEVQAERVVLCVQGEYLPTGQALAVSERSWCGGYRGMWVAVTPRETQAMLVAGAVLQGGGMGMDSGKSSCSV